MSSASKHMHLLEPSWKVEWRETWTLSDKDVAQWLISGNTRFIRIFQGFPRVEPLNDNVEIENMDFHGFEQYAFSTLGNEASYVVI